MGKKKGSYWFQVPLFKAVSSEWASLKLTLRAKRAKLTKLSIVFIFNVTQLSVRSNPRQFTAIIVNMFVFAMCLGNFTTSYPRCRLGGTSLPAAGFFITSSRHRPGVAHHRCTPVLTWSARLCVGTGQSAAPVRVVDRGDVCVLRRWRWWMLRGRLDAQYGGGRRRQRGSGDSTRDFVE